MKIQKKIRSSFLFIAALYLTLLIPDTETVTISKPSSIPFEWKQDSLWQKLEQDFARAQQEDTQVIHTSLQALCYSSKWYEALVNDSNWQLTDTLTRNLLLNYFQRAALTAAHPAATDSLVQYYNAIRKAVKQQSRNWNIHSGSVRNNLYQLLYGMRMATEEVLLQAADKDFQPLLTIQDEPSATPSTTLFGIKVHSGDLLLSRGGAEVSALISRGNNYPGNFSHVALLYVNEKTNTPYLIEAHIEKGVAVSSAEQYIKDKKLRCMVLRPYAGLAQLKNDPMLPHKAAAAVYEQARRHHIPYDFTMNFHDSTAMFCSEVGSYAYRKKGLQLWNATSVISSPGVISWLSDFGVENFETQMPADLEYDPQLCVVAEWRDPATLMKDHIDNAVMDALLEQADMGRKIDYNIWQLPLVRVVKGWCILKNMFGGVGIIPEGMSATRALKNQQFVAMYQEVKKVTEKGVQQFRREKNYSPPYWQLLAMARKASTK